MMCTPECHPFPACGAEQGGRWAVSHVCTAQVDDSWYVLKPSHSLCKFTEILLILFHLQCQQEINC
eukprot:5099125-Amphidinium_carterae.1